MVLVDSNILGTLARVGRLQLLFDLFDPQPLGVTPAVFGELQAGMEHGALFLRGQLTSWRAAGSNPLTVEESLAQKNLPSSSGAGERESVAVCRARGYVFLTNDKRARNFCRTEGIEALDLAGMLRALWKTDVLSKKKVKSLIADIETKEKLVIKDKSAVFAKR